MFSGFANVWTPVELSRNLKKAPMQVTVAGEKVALFRDAKGAPAALIDRCPHRGVALSLGKVTADGCLSCPFHGWEFDAQGKCGHVPFNPDAKRERLFATALPVRERGGFIWLYTAPVEQPPSEPVVPEAFEDPAFVVQRIDLRWNAHWTRAMENMLDSPHLPFVHRKTIGFPIRRRMTRESKAVVTYEETATGGRLGFELEGAPRQGALLEFNKPNGMVLHIPIPGKRMRIHVHCVPVDDGHTRMFLTGTRDFGRFNPFVRMFDEVNRLIAYEDKAIVESSSPAEVPPASQEVSVPTDRGTLQFRKYYYEVLKDSSADPKPKLRRVDAA
ncbi:MAG: aromatic ring-hydroxylating dioxygenase subunit alpha [Myxococcaceae bacterium]|nr:aromatic ring-hydroxylating dioxygenase subunit alpha [Myxococcaceae bacterium]